jgi:hypothetical protein
MLALAVTCAAGCGGTPASSSSTIPWQDHRFIAHGLGVTPDGASVTNSLEAFEHSYALGFRVFEADFVTLADGSVFVQHDNHEWKLGFERGTSHFSRLERSQVEGRLHLGKYQTMFAEQLIEILAKHPDMTLVADPKWARVEIITKLVAMTDDPAVKDRIVPHVHSEEELLGYKKAWDFPSFMFAYYGAETRKQSIDQVIALMKRHDMDSFMVRHWLMTPQLERRLRDGGIEHLFVHSLATEAAIRKFLDRGIGMYSNSWIDPEVAARATK